MNMRCSFNAISLMRGEPALAAFVTVVFAIIIFPLLRNGLSGPLRARTTAVHDFAWSAHSDEILSSDGGLKAAQISHNAPRVRSFRRNRD